MNWFFKPYCTKPHYIISVDNDTESQHFSILISNSILTAAMAVYGHT